MFDLQSVCFTEVTHESSGSLVDGRTFGDCLELLWEGTMLEIWKGNYIHDRRRGNQNNRIRNPPAEAAARVMDLDVLRVFPASSAWEIQEEFGFSIKRLREI